MNIKSCKNCTYYSLDTLTDGTKEHYCYPTFPFLTVPCKLRKKRQCKEILKMETMKNV